jgi:hypothetical protein
VHRALRLQSRLDEDQPLRLSLVPHTHNSGNATAYRPTLSTADPNQRYTVFDQLRMGIRGIELDLHWHVHPSGTPETDFKAVVECHGRTEGAGPLVIHLGCTADRLAEEGLAELAAFLAVPGNEREVVLLYLENQLDGDPRAHEQISDAIERHLGDLVARPPAGQPCATLPYDTSRADLLAAGHQVLVVGNCGPASWGTLGPPARAALGRAGQQRRLPGLPRLHRRPSRPPVRPAVHPGLRGLDLALGHGRLRLAGHRHRRPQHGPLRREHGRLRPPRALRRPARGPGVELGPRRAGRRRRPVRGMG